MALGRLLTRSTKYTVTDTVSGASAVYTVLDNLGPDWASSSAYRGAMSIPGAWSAVIVGAGLAIVAFIMAKKGIDNLKAGNLAPERTARAAARDVTMVKEKI